MRPAVKQWLDEVRHNNAARRANKCKRCDEQPIVAQREEDDGVVRVLYWCLRCQLPAFGSGSCTHVDKDALAALPIVGDPRQGDFLR